jgi:hypothetical protein
MGKEGINSLNDVVYITLFIMVSIEGKSREYYARAAWLICRKGGKQGLVPARNALKKTWPGDSLIESQATGIGNSVFSR